MKKKGEMTFSISRNVSGNFCIFVFVNITKAIIEG